MLSEVSSVRPWCGALDPFGGAALGAEIGVGAVKIVFRVDLEAEDFDCPGVGGLLKDNRVVAALFHGAKIEMGWRFIRHLQAQGVDIKGARGGKVGDIERDMGKADGVEGRFKDRGGDGHQGVPFRMLGWRARFPDGAPGAHAPGPTSPPGGPSLIRS